MPSKKNLNIVAETTEKFEKYKGVYFANYTGMDVPTLTNLRKSFAQNSVNFAVVKNTLTKIASKNAGYDGTFDSILTGQVGIVFSEDPVTAAKVIKEFKDNNKDSLEILGVLYDGKLYDSDKYKQLAVLPSKEELLGKFVSCLNSPMYKLASTLNSSMSKVVFALRAIQK